MESMTQELMAQLAPIVAGLIATLISVGLVRLNAWLKAKGNLESLAVATDVVAATVSELSATVVKDIKAAAEDGKLTPQEAAEIKMSAVARVKQQLPKGVIKASTVMVGNFDAYVRGKIEQEVAAAKVGQPELIQGVSLTAPDAE